MPQGVSTQRQPAVAHAAHAGDSRWFLQVCFSPDRDVLGTSVALTGRVLRIGREAPREGDHEGAFQRAHRGTLFLDEVGHMPLDVQPKLLRALENGEVTPLGASAANPIDVRIAAATHVPLEAAVEAGRFREDPDALQWQLEHLDEAMQAPIRSRNVPELAMLAGETNDAEPGTTQSRQRPPTRDELVALLAWHDGNVSAVAAQMQRNRKQVYRWMDQHGLHRGSGR